MNLTDMVVGAFPKRPSDRITDPSNRCERATAIWQDDEYAELVGKRLAVTLGLDPRPLGGCYETLHGPKSDIGLARLVLDTIGIY